MWIITQNNNNIINSQFIRKIDVDNKQVQFHMVGMEKPVTALLVTGSEMRRIYPQFLNAMKEDRATFSFYTVVEYDREHKEERKKEEQRRFNNLKYRQEMMKQSV